MVDTIYPFAYQKIIRFIIHLQKICIILPQPVQFSQMSRISQELPLNQLTHSSTRSSPSHLHFKHHLKIDNLLLFWHFSFMKKAILHNLWANLLPQWRKKDITEPQGKTCDDSQKKKKRWWSNSDLMEVQSERNVAQFHSERRWFKAKNNVFHLHSAIYGMSSHQLKLPSPRRDKSDVQLVLLRIRRCVKLENYF